MFFVLMREFKTFDRHYWMCWAVTHLSLIAYLWCNDRPLKWTTLMVFIDSLVALHSKSDFALCWSGLRNVFDLFRFGFLYLQLLSSSRLVIFLWWLLSIFLLKVFLDVLGILAWSWKWANFFGQPFFITTEEQANFFGQPFFITAEE